MHLARTAISRFSFVKPHKGMSRLFGNKTAFVYPFASSVIAITVSRHRPSGPISSATA